MDVKTIEVSSGALIGSVKYSGLVDVKGLSEFSDKVEALMLQYKISKIDLCFDPWEFAARLVQQEE